MDVSSSEGTAFTGVFLMDENGMGRMTEIDGRIGIGGRRKKGNSVRKGQEAAGKRDSRMGGRCDSRMGGRCDSRMGGRWILQEWKAACHGEVSRFSGLMKAVRKKRL